MDAATPTQDTPPAGLDAVLRRMIALREAETDELKREVQRRNERIGELDTKAHELAAIIERLDRGITERDRQLAELHDIIAAQAAQLAGTRLAGGWLRLKHRIAALDGPDNPPALRAAGRLARTIRSLMRR